MLYNCFRNANFGNNNGMVFGALNIKLYLHLCCLFVHSWDVSLLIGVLFSIRSLTIGENYAISLYFLHHWLESISFTLSNILPIPSYAFPCSSTLYLICSVLAAQLLRSGIDIGLGVPVIASSCCLMNKLLFRNERQELKTNAAKSISCFFYFRIRILL